MTAKWKLAEGKTWRSKLKEPHPSHGEIVEIPERLRRRLGEGTVLIPRPADVDARVRKTPKGKVLTVSKLRAQLATDAGADHACPLTTGIFLKIVAEASEEARREGKVRITPYWRVVRDDGSLMQQFPGGVRAQAKKLREEGVAVAASGRSRKPRVASLGP